MYAIGDTETCGLGKNKVACEVAWIELDEDMNILAEHDYLVDPQIPITPGATEIHGITDDMVADAPTMQELVDVILKGKRPPVTLIGHNVSFDAPLMSPIFEKIEATVCTLALSRFRFPNAPNHKLGTMGDYLGIQKGTAHRALGDCMTVYEIVKKIMADTGKTFVQMCAPTRRTIHTMPFGEHKGTALMALPFKYRTWLLSVEIDPDLRHSLMQLRDAGL